MEAVTDMVDVPISVMEAESKSREQVPSKAIRIKQEFPVPYGPSSQKAGSSNSRPKIKSTDEKPRTKRPYVKRRVSESSDMEKPPPKKRGRKSREELLQMENQARLEEAKREEMLPPSHKKFRNDESFVEIDTKTMKVKNKLGKNTKKGAMTPKIPTPTSSLPNLGTVSSTMFDRKILAGPHLTMKQVLEYILTDHSYCVPPDPLPAVGSNHQMIRYILGPKDGAKPRSLPTLGVTDSGNNTPLAYSASRSRSQLALSGTASPSSKLENLLKRGGEAQGSSSRISHSKNNESKDELDVEIDIESVDPELERRISYDVQRAKDVMNECERYVEFARGTDTGDDWESKILKTGWTKTQSSLFEKIVGALHAERLSRLTFSGLGDTEPVLRRASLDKTACRVRRIFGEFLWDTKLMQWLHAVLTESLNFHYLAIYLDVLQTLKSQCPQLVSRMMKLSVAVPLQNACGREEELANLLTPFLDKEGEKGEFGDAMNKEVPKTEADMEIGGNIMENANTNSEILAQNATAGEICGASDGTLKERVKSEILLPARSIVPQMKDAIMNLQSAKNAEALKSLLSRPWDPFSSTLLHRLKKLSNNPMFLMIAPGAIYPKSSLNRRLKQYYRMFNRVGQIVKVHHSSSSVLDFTSVSQYLDKVMQLAKEKMRQTRHRYPERPIYIVGWGAGSILAAKLSVLSGPADGIIALGFPLHSIRDIHDDILKIFSGIKHPILFVIGGNASNNSLTDMELFRKRLTCETSLVVVGSGNENLYVTRDHREKLLVTQSFVDKTVMDEIAYFVNLHSKHNQVILPHMNMKQSQFPKFSGNTEVNPLTKSIPLLRNKKRKSSLTGFSVDGEGVGSPTTPMTPTALPRTMDADFSKFSSELDLKTQGYGPLTLSTSKRKSPFTCRTESPLDSQIMSSSGSMTASKLLQQQTPKRRLSKPSGIQRPSLLLNQQQGLRTPEGGQEVGVSPTSQVVTSVPAPFMAQGNSNFSSQTSYPDPNLSNNVMGNFTYSNPLSAEKPARKKSTKPKTPRPPKVSSSDLPTSSILSAINDVANSKNLVPSSSASSALDMHRFVLQHKEEMKKQVEVGVEQKPSTSHLFRLLSPDSETPKIDGKSGSYGAETTTRTAFISKRNICYAMTIPTVPVVKLGTTVPPESLENNVPSPHPILTSVSAGNDILKGVQCFKGEEKILIQPNQMGSSSDVSSGAEFQLVSVGHTSEGSLSGSVQETAILPDTDFVEQAAPIEPTPISLPTSSIIISSPTETLTESAMIIPEAMDIQEGVPVTCILPDLCTVEESNVEQVGTEEPLELDTDDEMSGLKISSTFSVCPTSGERVNLVATSLNPDQGDEAAPTSAVKSEETSTSPPTSSDSPNVSKSLTPKKTPKKLANKSSGPKSAEKKSTTTIPVSKADSGKSATSTKKSPKKSSNPATASSPVVSESSSTPTKTKKITKKPATKSTGGPGPKSAKKKSPLPASKASKESEGTSEEKSEKSLKKLASPPPPLSSPTPSASSDVLESPTPKNTKKGTKKPANRTIRQKSGEKVNPQPLSQSDSGGAVTKDSDEKSVKTETDPAPTSPPLPSASSPNESETSTPSDANDDGKPARRSSRLRSKPFFPW